MVLSIPQIDRYLFRLILVPLLSCLLIAVMLLTLERLANILQFVAVQGGAISVAWKMIANLIPEYLGLGIPLGLLLGVLFAFRRLATNSELDILLSVGFSYKRLLRVPMLFAFGLAALNVVILGFAQPYSRYIYE